jgi:hypothetical protein
VRHGHPYPSKTTVVPKGSEAERFGKAPQEKTLAFQATLDVYKLLPQGSIEKSELAVAVFEFFEAEHGAGFL